MVRKKSVRVGLHGKSSSMDGMYSVHWGSTGTSYNRNYRKFRKLTTAKTFVRTLVNRLSKRYNVKFVRTE